MKRLIPVLLTTVALAGCQGSDRSTWSADQPVTVSSVGAPVAVSGIGQPVTIAGVAQPVAIAGVAQPVAVSAVLEPVAISSVAAPVRLVRPDLDPERIVSGSDASGTVVPCLLTCREVLSGPFVLTDLVIGQTSGVWVAVGPSLAAPRWRGHFPLNTSIAGGRFAVREGEKLYFESVESAGFVWSGFRP